MNQRKLSKPIIDAALPQEARYTLWDVELSGFGLRVEPSGTKSFIAKYRSQGGGRNAPQRLVVIGRFPKISVPEARAAAKKVLAGAELGMDAAGDLAARRKEMTVTALVDLYADEGCFIQRGIRQGQPMKVTTKAYTISRLRNHVVPLLGTKRASEITAGDIETFVRAVATGKTAKDEKIAIRKRIIVRGGAGAARKVVRDLSAVFSFAMRRKIVAANPVATASVRKTDNQRTRFLTIDEVRRLGKALDELEGEGVNKKAVDIARLWVLTGCRREEIASLCWQHCDLERGMLVLTDSKTGHSVRPLGAAAVSLLTALKEQADAESVFVFPAERLGKAGYYQGTKRVFKAAIERANLPGVSPHTLRHTLGSAAASSGEAMLLIGSILGHSNARSTAIYAHVQNDPARLAADRVTGPLAEALLYAPR